MTSVQLHRPRVGETFTAFDGREWTIEKIWYETHRATFRVTYLDPDSATGVRGCQVSRGDGDDWNEWEPPKYVNQQG